MNTAPSDIGRRPGFAGRPPARPPQFAARSPRAAGTGVVHPNAGSPRHARLVVLRDRVRWTLIFSAFFAFTGGVVASRLAIGQPLILIGVAGLLIQTQRLRVGPVPTLLALWTTWAAIGYVTSPYPDVVWPALQQLLKLCVITFVGVNALRTRGQIRAYCLFVLFAFLIYPARGTLLNWLTGALVANGSRAVWNGVYGNPNDLAGICLLILAVALAIVVSDRDRRVRLGALATAGLVSFLIFISQSRGALIALGVFVVALLVRMPARQRARAAFVTGALGAVVVLFAPSSVWERLSGLRNVTDTSNMAQVDPEGSADQRLEIWKVARTIIAEHPITGVGVGAYPEEHGIVAVRPAFRPTARGKRDTHSMYFNVMAETGVPGFFLFMIILVTTARYAGRVRRRVRIAFPLGALQIQFLQLGLLAFCIAGIWGSYAKMNILYLYLVLLWATAKVYEGEAARAGALAPQRGR
jgi:probable O-glycosylation ligase (exosortase A-associated)